MSKKKLLSEATIRRFMGLAGMDAKIVSNAINEMASVYEEEEEMGAEEPAELPAEEPEMADMKMDDAEGEEMGDAEGVVNLDQELVDDLMAAKETIIAVADALGGEMAPEGEPEMDMAPDMPAEEPAEEPAGMEDEEDAEMLEGVDLQLSEDEIVQEVARRVAKRILQAKKAKAQLDEALGRKPRRQK